MACEFDVAFNGSAEDIVAGAGDSVLKAGGTVDGDTSQGSFSVPNPKVQGTYTISGQKMAITITKKPTLVPCGVIEGYIKKQFKKADT